MSMSVPPQDATAAQCEAAALPALALDAAGLAALELLLDGALAPLEGFRLTPDADGTPALPLRLRSGELATGTRLALHDSEGVALAVCELTAGANGDSGQCAAARVHAIRMPARELFAHQRKPVAAIRAALATSGRSAAICLSLRGVPDSSACERIGRLAGDDALLLRVMDDGDADRAHQLGQRLEAAGAIARSLGEARCVLAICPDPHPQAGAQQAALDALYAHNAGCARNAQIDGTHAPGTRSPFGGLCVFFTGLSGSGKSTVARALHTRVVERTGCAVTLLDGDAVRRHLSRGLGFSREDRDANVLRISYVASRVVMHAGLVICAPIAPYAATRGAVRDMVRAHGRFIEVHVATPLNVCETRDPKALYARARRAACWLHRRERPVRSTHRSRVPHRYLAAVARTGRRSTRRRARRLRDGECPGHPRADPAQQLIADGAGGARDSFHR